MTTWVVSISVGTSGVSFWSGVGDDTFSFSTITNDGGTAYFWNEGGTDSIVLGGAVSTAAGGAPIVFGVTKGASMNISFAAGSVATSATTTFGAGTMSSSWSVANSNLVSFGFGSTMTTIVFSGGGLATLQGGVFETAAGTNIFDTAKASTGTGLFGIAGLFQPSADHSFRKQSVDHLRPLARGGFFYSRRTTPSIWLPYRLQLNLRRCLLGAALLRRRSIACGSDAFCRYCSGKSSVF